MPDWVSDTHALVWHLQRSPLLTSAARQFFQQAEAGQGSILVPTIALVEIIYLAERKRVAAPLVRLALDLLRAGPGNYRVVPLDLDIVEALEYVPQSLIPDMAGRVIAATALRLDRPLLTCNQAMGRVPGLRVIW